METHTRWHFIAILLVAVAASPIAMAEQRAAPEQQQEVAPPRRGPNPHGPGTTPVKGITRIQVPCCACLDGGTQYVNISTGVVGWTVTAAPAAAGLTLPKVAHPMTPPILPHPAWTAGPHFQLATTPPLAPPMNPNLPVAWVQAMGGAPSPSLLHASSFQSAWSAPVYTAPIFPYMYAIEIERPKNCRIAPRRVYVEGQMAGDDEVVAFLGQPPRTEYGVGPPPGAIGASSPSSFGGPGGGFVAPGVPFGGTSLGNVSPGVQTLTMAINNGPHMSPSGLIVRGRIVIQCPKMSLLNDGPIKD